MARKIRPFWIYVFFFILGFSLALLIPNTLDVGLDIAKSSDISFDRSSPGDWISEDQIKVSEDEIKIKVKGARWAKLADTNSMDPLFDSGANVLQLVPSSENDLNIGDIITYRSVNSSIIHRIIYIGNDGDWYAIVKGDNNPQPDPSKIRFKDVEKVLFGIIY